MDDRKIPLVDEEPKYRKKSTAKGQPRSKHKHTYETVLLTRCYHNVDYKTGKPKDSYDSMPTKVCTICGRIDYVDWDESYYTKRPISGIPFLTNSNDLSEKALALPRWHCDFFDKFAIKDEE